MDRNHEELPPQPPAKGVFLAGRFAFERGGELEEMRVGYATWGRLNEARDNAILLLPGSSQNRLSAAQHVGPGMAYDTDRYFVVSVDAIGGGASSSPRDGLGPGFPRYTIGDMVRAQHELVTRGLCLERLLAACGPSAGSYQALEWGIRYPGFVRGLVLIVPAARSGRHVSAIVDAFEAMITLDPAYRDGRYETSPREGVRRAALVYLPWITSDAYLDSLDGPAYERAKAALGQRWASEWDANDLLWRFRASRDYDASEPFGGDRGAALGRVEARALLLASTTDRTVPANLTRELHSGLRDATLVEIPSLLGHAACERAPGTAEYALIRESVRAFLAGLRSRPEG